MSDHDQPLTRSEAVFAERLRDFVDHLEVPSRHTSASVGACESDEKRGDGRFSALRVVEADDDASRPSSMPRVGQRRRSVLFAVAASLALVMTALFTLPRFAPVPAVGEAAVLPTELRGYRLLNTPLEWSPPGRVLMSYVDHEDAESFLDRYQTIVLGSDARTYRSLGIADKRLRLGSPAPVEISPDGSILAVGSPAWGADVIIVDAATGEHRSIHVTGEQFREIDPLTWSPDGGILYLLDRPSTGSWPLDPGRVMRVDVEAGTVEPMRGLEDVRDVSMSDDPSRLLVARAGRVEIVSADDGSVLESLQGVSAPSVAHNAWSPDGSKILTFDDTRIHGPLDIFATLYTRDPDTREWTGRMLPGLGRGRSMGIGGQWQGGAWVSNNSYLMSPSDGDVVVFDVDTATWSEVSRTNTDDTGWLPHNVDTPPRDRVFARELVRHLVLTRAPLQEQR